MNKKILIIITASVLGLVLTSGILIVAISGHKPSEPAQVSSDTPDDTDPQNQGDEGKNDNTYIPPTLEGTTPTPSPIPIPTEPPFVPDFTLNLDPSSIAVFVNKEHALPKDYKPENLVVPNVYFDLTYYDERTLMRPEAAAALEQLFVEAEKDGFTLCGVSAYRSYTRQYNIFTNNILTKGKEHTLKYSAVPGTSEHQTGLSIDVSCESLNFDLSTAFSDTPEGKWLAQNSYLFGYIIRYPKGKGDITGYAYEPWHIRYVGRGMAKYLYENDLTLEEYYRYTPSKDFDFEALYADLINITPSVTMMPSGTPGAVLDEDGDIIDGDYGDATPTIIITPTVTAAPAVSATPTPNGSHPTATQAPEDGNNPDNGGDTSNPDGGSLTGTPAPENNVTPAP